MHLADLRMLGDGYSVVSSKMCCYFKQCGNAGKTPAVMSGQCIRSV